ncbi:Fanconi anemia core complex-associated protein 20 isoform X1 [Lepus europaeus]|uniref:Fanconi anemia core complex-associated protein 20 isoform X1 n=1 Tax=Lepus europaeus TaxID=9983 RepID=UPI002B4A0514|nr:Fanconi anemia core complex-associated protein 20 isoform X1 [Lepus europaeus]
MEAAKRPRLRLSRRRPAAEGGGRPWFLAGGECELWATLLRTVSADLRPDGELPPLPAFPGQEPGRGPQPADPGEAFSVGPQTFSWTPFPQPARGSRCSYRLLRGAAAPASEWPGTPGRPDVRRPPALRSCPMCQREFGPGLAQLDIDSHLAQCLAESTEDVVW